MIEDPHVPHHDISSTLGNSFSPPPSILDDTDLPIALRKGARSYVQYPIANYVSYSALSPSTCSFFIELSFVSTPNSLFEVLSQPKWKEAIEEEMWTLEKNYI